MNTAVAERAETMPPTMAEPVSTALTPMQMAYQLIQGGADLGSVKEFLAMSKELAADEARRAFELAVSEAKAEIPVIEKNRHVGFASRKEGAAKTDYWHEDFAQVARTVDPILSRHGLSYRHEADQEGALLSVTCVLSHRDGHATRTTLKAGNDMTGNKNPIQAVGSTATFLQRYTLKLALGLAASKDDDATKAADIDEAITAEQCTELLALIEDTKTDIALFCKYYKIEAVPELPASKFASAKARLAAKKAA